MIELAPVHSAAEVRERAVLTARSRAALWNTPHAVRDDGIDLKRKRLPKPALQVAAPAEPEPPAEPPPVDPAPVSEPTAAPAATEIAWSPPMVEQIKRAVCLRYGLSRIDLVSQRRTADIVRPRQIAMYLAKTITLNSYPEIGQRFGGRDHTTILHACRKIERLIAAGDDALRAEVEALRRELVGDA